MPTFLLQSLPPPPLLALGCCLPCSTPPGSLPLRRRNRSLMILPRLLALSVFHLSRCWARFVRIQIFASPSDAVHHRSGPSKLTGLPPGIREGGRQCEQDTWILQLLIAAGGDILGILALGLLEDDFDCFEQFLKV